MNNIQQRTGSTLTNGIHRQKNGGHQINMRRLIVFSIILVSGICGVLSKAHGQTTVNIFVYDGMQYVMELEEVAIESAQILYQDTIIITDSLGGALLTIGDLTETTVTITHPDFEAQEIRINTKKDDVNNCSGKLDYKVYLGVEGSTYGYLSGRRVPFQLRDGFAALVLATSEESALSLIPTKYHSNITVRSLSKSTLRREFLVVVDSIDKHELGASSDFAALRNAGARLGPITTDNEMIINSSVFVIACNSKSVFTLRKEVLKAFPELEVGFGPASDCLHITLPNSVCFDIFLWMEKLNQLRGVHRISFDPIPFLTLD
jgi:hypothetical protein